MNVFLEMKSPEWLSRTELLIGQDKLEKLKNSNVLIVGLGGVGGYAAEAICRAGIGNITLVDGDKINESNRNRQLLALVSSQGKDKTEIMARRLEDINPMVNLKLINKYVQDNQMNDIVSEEYDYVIDAVDTLAPKLNLIYHSLRKKLRIVSSLGSGGKLDPMQIKIADISESYNCRLAYYLRKKLHKLEIYNGFKVVFSPEPIPRHVLHLTDNDLNKKSVVGTISYMPPLFGCMVASVVIMDLIEDK
jgi:tRNA threonylcarbamoyladenosine dehydratase